MFDQFLATRRSCTRSAAAPTAPPIAPGPTRARTRSAPPTTTDPWCWRPGPPRPASPSGSSPSSSLPWPSPSYCSSSTCLCKISYFKKMRRQYAYRGLIPALRFSATAAAAATTTTRRARRTGVRASSTLAPRLQRSAPTATGRP